MSFPTYTPITAGFHSVMPKMGFVDYSIHQRLIRGHLWVDAPRGPAA